MITIITVKPGIEISPAIKNMVQEMEERSTIVHCRYHMIRNKRVRIWPETSLNEEDSQRRKLIRAFNIALMPDCTAHNIQVGFFRFTLVFEGLGKKCRSFQLLEDIPESGGFYSDKIQRNQSDVYDIEVFSFK